MAVNGAGVKVEQKPNMDYTLQSSEYQELIGLGLEERVAQELDEIFQSGMMRRDEIDQRAVDGLVGLDADSAMAVLAELKGSSLQSVTNKSAYMCGIMKAMRHKVAAGIVTDTKKPGPDEAKLKEILDRTGYSLEITSGQRKYGGPPPNYTGPDPGAGHEVFCGKLPTNVFEDTLIPLFEKAGEIWDLRLMMDPTSGCNKTFCFIMYTTREAANKAVSLYDNYEIRPGKRIKVNISIAKLRLFVGNIPKQRGKEEIMAEFSNMSEGLKDVIVYSNPDDPSKRNRGFAFLDYDSHKNASAAKRKMESGVCSAWSRHFVVSWAEPQDEPDPEVMAKVKVLYVKNLKSLVTEEQLREVFQQYGSIDRVKKTKDYGFIHFENREDALRAMEELNGTSLADTTLDISLAKPPSKGKRMDSRGGPGGGGFHQSNRGGGRGFGGRGRGRGTSAAMSNAAMMGYGGAGDIYGMEAYDPYGYDMTGGYDDYYGYDDYSGYDYGYGVDMSYMMPPAPKPAMGYGRGRGFAAGRSRGMTPRGARGGAARGGMGAGMTPRGRGGMRGGMRGGPMKRKAGDGFAMGGEAKRFAAAAAVDPWSAGDDWSTQPIVQQPLGDAEWYQDSWY